MATLHPRMFIPQATLEAWVDSGQAALEGEVVHLARSGRGYRLDAAVRFLAVVAAPGDTALVGKVLSERRIAELGGELLGDSVLFGDAAFQVEPGYIGTLVEAPLENLESESR